MFPAMVCLGAPEIFVHQPLLNRFMSGKRAGCLAS